MFKLRFRLPSPALVISMVALALVLGGTAVAATVGKHADAKADTKLVKKLAPSLSVKHAMSADTATSATSATNATHATSADSATNATNAGNATTLGGQSASAFASSSAEATRLVGGTGQPGFLNSWSNFGGTQTAGFYKDPWGIVHLRGLITGGTTPAVIFTLPSGYAPGADSYFPVMTCGGYGDILIKANGDVRSRTTASNFCLSLDGVTFRAGS